MSLKKATALSPQWPPTSQASGMKVPHWARTVRPCSASFASSAVFASMPGMCAARSTIDSRYGATVATFVEDDAVAGDVRARGDVAAVLRRLIGAGFDPNTVVVGRANHAGALVAKGVGEGGAVGVAVNGVKHAVISVGADGLVAVPVDGTLVRRGK